MKKALEIILSVVCFAAIILAGAENPDGSCNVKWTLGFLALAVASGYVLNRIMEKR
jgi:hypothetical protein